MRRTRRIGLVPLALALACLAAPPAAAATPAAATALRIPAPQRYELANGLRVIVLPLRGLPLVDFELQVESGSAADPAGKEGLANLTADLLTRGAGSRDAVAFAEAVEFIGGQLDADAGLERTVVRGEFLSQDFERGLDLLADVVLEPAFRGEELERARAQILGRIENDKDEPGTLASQRLQGALFAGHRFAHPTYGTAASVKSLSRDDVAAFHRDAYVADRAVLVVVGDVDTLRARRAIEERFARMSRGSRPASGEQALPAAAHGRRVVLVSKPDQTQTEIRIGNLSLPRNHPDRFPVLVANTILGAGFTSRLMNELRVDRGLTYSIATGFDGRRRTGSFVLATSTRNESTREAIDAAFAEMRKLRDEGPTRAEIEGAKNYLKGQFPLQLEAPDDLARLFADVEFYGLPHDYPNRYWERIDAVTEADVRRVLREHFPLDDLVIVLVGNPEQIRSQVESLGPVELQTLD